MGDLFEVVANQFQSNTQYDKFIKESQRQYDVKIYRLSTFAQAQAKQIYQELLAKYQDSTLTPLPHGWYQNERRLYVWFIICFIHYKAIDPVKFIDGYEKYWRHISQAFWEKEVYFLKYQLLNIFKIKGRTIWKAEEDELLRDSFRAHQFGEWNEVAKTFYQRSNGRYFKTPKQCRERWQNHLNNMVKKGEWSLQQDLKIFELVESMGTKWAKIASELNRTRTEHMIKNRYKSLVSKIVNERNVGEKEAADIMLKELLQRVELMKKEKKPREELGIEEVESEEIVEESQIIESSQQVQISKKDTNGKKKKIIKKEERQSVCFKSNGWKTKKFFDMNKSIKYQGEASLGLGQIQNSSYCGISLDDSMKRQFQVFKFEQANKSNIFVDFSSMLARSSFKKDASKKEGEKSIIYFENESGRSKKSQKNKSLIGQYLFD